MHFQELTIKSFVAGLREKRFSALEATDACLDAIAERDAELGAYLLVRNEQARVEAKDVDARLARGEELPLLAGVPMAIKDYMVMAGEVTTAGSKILEHYVGAYDATVVKKLAAAGAVVLGKTNLDEFAMGVSTENSGFHPTKNPHDTSRVPGGSSGGSAVAVASGMALAALGSDTGGSIRQPAAFCGVVGLKPTYGTVSRFGLIAMASSLDQIGPFGRTVRDAASVFHAIRGRDPYDATSVEWAYESPGQRTDDDAKRLTIGVPKEFFGPGLDPKVARALEEARARLTKLGFTVKEISLPHVKLALSTYYIVVPAEVSANLARFDGIRYERNYKLQTTDHQLHDLYFKTRGAGFGKEVRRRILLGTFVLSAGYYDAYYAKAQKVRRLIYNDFESAFDPSAGGVDVIFAPTTPAPAFRFGEKD